MKFFTKQRRGRWLIPLGVVAAAFGLIFSLNSAAHADINYKKEISNWSSGNDSGGRDASARLRAPDGNVHYKGLFRAYDEIIHIYDYYDEGSVNLDGVVEIRIYNKYGSWAAGPLFYNSYSMRGYTHRAYEIYYHDRSDVPEGYKIQLRLCRRTQGGALDNCTPWVYGIA